MNDAFQHKSAKPHVHWHIRPRYERTISFDGLEFIDPLFGYHYDRGQSQVVSKETLNKIQAKILDNCDLGT